ncbi:MAG: hypothetical protein JXR37_26845 [Kiritimatiellae bacterium]|nr:hypothetical protein [Kiritimatiellia bacterium]
MRISAVKEVGSGIPLARVPHIRTRREVHPLPKQELDAGRPRRIVDSGLRAGLLDDQDYQSRLVVKPRARHLDTLGRGLLVNVVA